MDHLHFVNKGQSPDYISRLYGVDWKNIVKHPANAYVAQRVKSGLYPLWPGDLLLIPNCKYRASGGHLHLSKTEVDVHVISPWGKIIGRKGSKKTPFRGDGRFHLYVWPEYWAQRKYITRFEYPDIAQRGFRYGLPEIPADATKVVTPGKHALGEGRGPFRSASTLAKGATKFKGKKLLIDAQKFVEQGGEIISNDAIRADMKRTGYPDGRIHKWVKAQQFEQEVLLKGKISTSALNTSSKVAAMNGARFLGYAAVGVSAYRLYDTSEKSFEEQTPRPVVAQIVREAGGWGAAWAAAEGAALLAAGTTWETGPAYPFIIIGAGIIGGWLGYTGSDMVADFIDED